MGKEEPPGSRALLGGPLFEVVWKFRRPGHESMPRLMRYFLTIRANLKVMASSNSRRSRPVSFLIFSSR